MLFCLLFFFVYHLHVDWNRLYHQVDGTILDRRILNQTCSEDCACISIPDANGGSTEICNTCYYPCYSAQVLVGWSCFDGAECQGFGFLRQGARNYQQLQRFLTTHSPFVVIFAALDANPSANPDNDFIWRLYYTQRYLVLASVCGFFWLILFFTLLFHLLESSHRRNCAWCAKHHLTHPPHPRRRRRRRQPERRPTWYGTIIV